MKEDRFLTVKELCQYLKIPKPTLYMFLGKGLIPAAKVGRQWRFNRDSIDKWMADKEKYYAERKDRRVART
ncbi:MAG: helix-turn-helix domain-containing protein [Candidatus Omnitrophica bacterium]|nr:helix-turn-helix domain-containing protein [Candidatus Omnitrophota bacterium]